MKLFHYLLICCFSLIYFTDQENQLPEGFSYVDKIIPGVILDMRYAGTNNFTGRKVKGYEKSKAILTTPVTKALYKVQQDLLNEGYCLKIFDAYRPQRAVNQFMEWSKDEADTILKQEFYPGLKKNNLFDLGYIAEYSGHSRGSTVDLTIVDADTEEEVDMGGSYDFFGAVSHHNSPQISEEQKQNRKLLKRAMMKHGFQPYYKEWWHYTFQPEPFPETYFDFVVE